MPNIYLDHAATTPCDVRVFEAMRPYFLDDFGNPSSPHAHGRTAKKAIEDSRQQVAGAISAQHEERSEEHTSELQSR